MKKTLFTSVLVLFTVSAVILSCQKSTPTPAPAANPYGAGNGNVSFYGTSNVAGVIDVTLNATTIHLSNYFSSGAPGCQAQGTASFILPAGTYNYTAQQTGGSSYWNGSVTITNGGCLTYALNGGGG